MSSAEILLDDRASAVSRSGTWRDGGSAREHMSTVVSSQSPGSYLDVRFTGTSIGVFGTYDVYSGGVVSSYSIDGGRADEWTANASGGDDTHKQQFWRSPQLAPGDHILRVTMLKVNTIPNQPIEGTIWFDYFSVRGGDAATSSGGVIATDGAGRSTTVSAPGSRTSQSPGRETVTVTGPGQSTPTTSSSANDSDGSPPMGAIVGGVVGGIVVLALILAFFFLRRRRRIRSQEGYLSEKPGGWPGTLHSSPAIQTPQAPGSLSNYPANQPLLGAAPGHLATDPSYYSDTSTPGKTSSYASQQQLVPTPRGALQVANPSADSYFPSSVVGAGSSTATDSFSQRGKVALSSDGQSVTELKRQQQAAVQANSGERQVIQHTDSGVRNPQPEEPIQLPPAYSAA